MTRSTYSFLVTNTGNVTLTSVGISDPLPGLSAVTCPVATLVPAGTTTCTATYTVTQGDVDAGSIANTANATGTPPIGAAVTAVDTALVSVNQSPAIGLAKSATPTAVAAAGDTVAYSFLVTNTGNVTLAGVGVSDPLPGLSAVSCPLATLAPGGSTTCTATYTVTQDDVDAGSIANTATATGTPPSGPAVTTSDPNTVTVGQSASIGLVKSPAPAIVSAAGDTVTYSFLVTNTGNVTLTGVTVTDPLAGLSPIACPVSSLAPTASTTCTATYAVPQADIDAGRIDNVATVTGTPPAGADVSDVATATVTAVGAPSIDLAKSADVAAVAAPGDVVAYSFDVTNTGNVTLTGVTVSDPLPGLSSISCPVSALAPGASTTCTAGYSATQADIDAGGIDNTATVAGSPPGGAAAVTATDTLSIPAVQSPSITLAKTPAPATATAAGQTVVYSFVVTNTGNVTLTSVGVADPLAGLSAVTCPIATLPPGTSTTCTASYIVTQVDVDAGAISNTAAASGTPPVGPPVTAVDSAVVIAIAAPSISLDKSATPNNVVAAGQTISYSFAVTNTGNVNLTGVTVTDPLPGLGAITCPASSLAPGASTTCTATYASTLVDLDAGSIVNTATVVAAPPVGAPVSDTGVASVTAVAAPAVQLVKSAAPTTVSAPGQTVTYSFEVTNTGNVTLAGIAVNDPLPGLGAISCPVATLVPAASTTCTAGYITTQADVDAGQIVNTAAVSATPPTGPVVGDADGTTVTATQTPAIQLAKDAAPATVTAAGQSVTYSFVVTNTGNVTLTGVGVTDPLPGLSGITCPVITLAPGASVTCTATYAVSQTDVDNGSIVNTAAASGTPPSGPAVTAVDGAVVTATPAPSIALVKSASPASVVAAGQTVTYSFVVTNTGNVTLTALTVADPLPGLSAIACPVASLAPSAATTCTATYVVTQADVDGGSIVNTATVAGTPPAGAPVTDTDGTTVTAVPAPSIAITKAASPNNVTVAGQVVSYSFVVTNTGNVTLAGVAVTDPLLGLSAIGCPVAVLVPTASTTCAATYTATQADVDLGSIPNTASVTANPPTGPAVTSTDSELVTVTQGPAIQVIKSAFPTTVTAPGQTIAYTFDVANTGNVTLTGVSVADPLPGLSAVTCPATSLAPGASMTCTASAVTTQADIDAGGITNTATASATPPVGAPVTDDDTAVVTATANPAVDLVKRAAPPTVASAGDTIAYAFDVTNTGNVTLSAITISDPRLGVGAVSCPVTTLAPGATTTCTAAYTVAQADVDAGTIVNTATVTAAPPVGPPVGDVSSSTVTAPSTPAIALVKSANPLSVTAAGDTVVYSFFATNTGNVTLTGVGVSDPLPGLGTVTCPTTTLAPGASTTCTAGYVVTQADIDAGTITNTATASGVPPTGPAVSVVDTAAVTATARPSITVRKTASPAAVGVAGQQVTYAVVVRNTGNVTLSAVTVTDPLPGLSPVTCPSSTLAPGASLTCTATYVVTQADVDAGSVLNTATAVATPPSGAPVRASAVAAVPISAAPAISLTKSASPTSVERVGEAVTYAFVVTNIGNVTVDGVVVTDPMVGLSTVTCPGFDGSLVPGEAATCAATYAATQADVDAGTIANTATASGTAPSGRTVTATDTVAVPVVPAPAITLVKTVSPSTVGRVGDVLTFTLVARNVGNVTLTNVQVTDALPGLSAVSCPGFGGSLVSGQSVACSATYTVTQADLERGSVQNTATVVASSALDETRVTAVGTVTVSLQPNPAISLLKSVSAANVEPGSSITYTFVVTNTGNVALVGVAVADPLAGLGAVTCGGFDGSLDPGEAVTCTATYQVSSGAAAGTQITNVATASGSSLSGVVVASTGIAVVTVRPGGTDLPDLPGTGSDVGGLVTVAAGLVGAGSLLLAVGRRRRPPVTPSGA